MTTLICSGNLTIHKKGKQYHFHKGNEYIIDTDYNVLYDSFVTYIFYDNNIPLIIPPKFLQYNFRRKKKNV